MTPQTLYDKLRDSHAAAAIAGHFVDVRQRC